MDLQHYKFRVRYEPGKANPADYSSRHPVSTSSRTSEITDHVAFVVKNAVPKAMTLEEVENATEEDPILKTVKSCIQSGNWYNYPPDVSKADILLFEKIRYELTCSDKLILKRNQIVIPASLQQRVIDIAHEGHLGVVKTKTLLREKVWFPRINQMVEETVKNCLPCQVGTPVNVKEPLIMSDLPTRPFEETSIDFATVEGELVLLLIDDYSRYPIIEPVSSTSASCVIPKLDQMFAMFGTPDVLRSDNGPPFNGNDFERFSKIMGFRHRRVTPRWPQGNAEVERMVQTLKKYVKTAKAEGSPWKKGLQAFLRNYRTSPHCTTGEAPSTLFLKRTVKTKLPHVPRADPISDIVRKRDTEQKKKIKMYADRKRYVKPSDLSVGDPVLVKRPDNLQKGRTPYEPKPLRITEKKGTMLTASDGIEL